MASLLVKWVLGRSRSGDHLVQELIWKDVFLQIEVVTSGVNSPNRLLHNQLLLVHVDPFAVHEAV